MQRALVTGGAGFLGSHLCERLLDAGHDVLCVDNFFTGSKAQRRAPARQSEFRADAPRRHLSALRGGRQDLQPRLPGLADSLPVRSGADDEDERARRHQHAGPGEAGAARILQASTSEVYGDPEVHPQTESYWGRVNPHRRRAACYDEGKRCAETLFFDYHRQHNLDIKVVRIFNTYGPRMHPNDGRVVSQLHRAGAAGRGRSRFTATARRPARSATSTI